jgi:arsenate reductase-like glutaredoxin family protein
MEPFPKAEKQQETAERIAQKVGTTLSRVSKKDQRKYRKQADKELIWTELDEVEAAEKIIRRPIED